MDSVLNLKVWDKENCVGDHALVTVDIIEETVQVELYREPVILEPGERGLAVRRKVADSKEYRENCPKAMARWCLEESKGEIENM
jgi:hypothetical protein